MSVKNKTKNEIVFTSMKDAQPVVGERCLFAFPVRVNGEVKDFRAFGYRTYDNTVYLPLHKMTLPMGNVSSWVKVPGEDFYNGAL